MLAAGADPHRNLREVFGQSIMCRTWIIDGRPGVLAGIVSTMAEPEGMVWMALTDDAMNYPNHVARGALRYLKEAMWAKTALRTAVMEGDAPALQFAYFLGFRAERAQMINGIPVRIMVYEKQRKVA